MRHSDLIGRLREWLSRQDEAALTPAMQRASLLTLATVAVALLIHRDTVAAMAQVWTSSETFAHGVLVPFATLYLVWRNRGRLYGLAPRFSVAGLAALVLASLGWLLAHLAQLQVGEHFALVAIVVATTWTLLGTPATRRLAFPLGFLFFAVPFGELLVPPLMEYTATFTVAMLQLTGVPVFRDGMYLSIPSGDFEVAQACSGIRYLLASVALGTLYAYLNFSSRWRRAAFLALAVIVPVVANGLRAYLIVLIAHLSDLRIAVGIDHYIYGWLFFGFVMFLLFWIGTLFHDTARAPESPPAAVAGGGSAFVALALAAAVSLAVTAAAPGWAGEIAARSADSAAAVSLPAATPPWRGPAEGPFSWQPRFQGASQSLHGAYRGPAGEVRLHLEYYARQEQGVELINVANRLYDGRPWVRGGGSGLRRVTVGGQRRTVNQLTLLAPGERRVVWYWYDVGGARAADELGVKLLQVAAALRGRQPPAALVAIGVAADADPAAAPESALIAFLEAHATALEACLTEGSCP